MNAQFVWDAASGLRLVLEGDDATERAMLELHAAELGFRDTGRGEWVLWPPAPVLAR